MRYLLGNVKKDGNLSFEDTIIIQHAVLNINTEYLTPEDYIIADTNKDGKVNSLDILEIQNYLISRRYQYTYNTINIEHGNTIVRDLLPAMVSPSEISGDYELKENQAYGIRFKFENSDNKFAFGSYAKEINIPLLNGDYVGFVAEIFTEEGVGHFYVFQHYDAVYELREFDGNINPDAFGSLYIEELYEINTSE